MIQDISVASEIHQFIVERFLFGEGAERLSIDDSFLERNLIDSTGVLELVAFVEARYAFKVNDEELVPDNLDSIRKIASFVERKRSL
jgi:acyl carrier protein